jgi:hypothetical protein
VIQVAFVSDEEDDITMGCQRLARPPRLRPAPAARDNPAMGRRVAVTVAVVLSSLLAGACGRIGFESPAPADGAVTDTAGADAGDPPSDALAAPPIDSPPTRIVYVGTFVQRSPGAGNPESFTAQARAPGNAIVLQVSCAGNAVPTGVKVTAAGWMFTQLGAIVASASSAQRSATFAAIAPDTLPATIAVSWTGSACGQSTNDLGDEFAMTDPAGGAITFDSSRTVMGNGDCAGSITTGHAGDVVWAACNTDSAVHAVGPGFIKGADDGAGDWSEYKITDDPAGTDEQVVLANDDVGYVLSMVTLKPR